MTWKNSAALIHIAALVVPAVLAALGQTGIPQLVAFSQAGAAAFTLVMALFHSTPTPDAAPAPVSAGIRLGAPDMPAPTLPEPPK